MADKRRYPQHPNAFSAPSVVEKDDVTNARCPFSQISAYRLRLDGVLDDGITGFYERVEYRMS